MQDELISFETAKLAKEKGFDQNLTELGFNISGFDCVDFPLEIMNGKDVYAQPTQSLLQRWLRENHTIFVGVNVNNDENEFYFELQSIFEYANQVVLNQDVCKKLHYTYEEALEVGLFEALKTLNNK